MKKFLLPLALLSYFLCAVVLLGLQIRDEGEQKRLAASAQHLAASEQTLAFACGYLYGQANIAEVLGHPEVASHYTTLPSCRPYAERAAAGGFTEVSLALKK